MKFVKTTLLVLVLLLGSVSFAWADPPWVFVEYIDMPNVTGEVSLFILPDGSGPAMNQAQIYPGTVVDATITLRLIDEWGVGIAGFPAEDIWLDAENDLQFFCHSGFSPDGVSTGDGLVTFSTSLGGGGSTEGPTYVYVDGYRAYDPMDLPYLTPHPPIPFRFNSADISGNGLVNLADLGLFAVDYYGEYNYRSDFFWDGYLNLSDVGRLVQGLTHNCQ